MWSETLKAVLAVGSGSFLGGAARYLVSLAMKPVGQGFPWGTLLVNLAGCLLIGLLWGWSGRSAAGGGALSLFLAVGVCGGFTTFSTFSKEALMLLQDGNVWGFAAYVAVSVAVGIAAVALGFFLSK